LNKKILINKVINRMQKLAMDEEHYYQTSELITLLESYLLDLSVELTGNIELSKITWENTIKAVGVEFADNYDSLAEKILDYMELVREYDSERIFITLNLWSYISDNEMNKFVNDVVVRGYKLLMLENTEYPIIEHEKRYIIDADKCIIC
jgi:CRISPR type II-A-associated protein Csn2